MTIFVSLSNGDPTVHSKKIENVENVIFVGNIFNYRVNGCDRWQSLIFGKDFDEFGIHNEDALDKPLFND